MSPTTVGPRTGIGLGLFKADLQIFDIGDLDAVDGEDGFETKSYFWQN